MSKIQQLEYCGLDKPQNIGLNYDRRQTQTPHSQHGSAQMCECVRAFNGQRLNQRRFTSNVIIVRRLMARWSTLPLGVNVALVERLGMYSDVIC